jgi:hypothetical protein
MTDQMLSLIVPETGQTDGKPVREQRGGGSPLEVRGPRWDAFVARLKRQEVKLADVRNDLVRMEGEIVDLLGDVGRRDPQGFRLSEVEVSLALSASGSIGIATGGIEAAIALTFSRTDGPS